MFVVKNPISQIFIDIYSKDLIAGNILNFDLGIYSTGYYTFWFLGDGSWSNEWLGQGATATDGSLSIRNVTIPTDIKFLRIQIDPNDSYADFKVFVDNIAIQKNALNFNGGTIKVTNALLSENGEGFVVNNPSNQIFIDIYADGMAGKTISFDLGIKSDGYHTYWFLGNGSWSYELFGTGSSATDGTLTTRVVSIPDGIEFLRIQIDPNSSYNGFEVYISNISVS